MHDMFWQPQNGERVMLKPIPASRWPFAVERDKPFVASLCNPAQQACWITPDDPKRRWHSSPIQMSDLLPAPQEGNQP